MALAFGLATEFADRESAERFKSAAAARTVTIRAGNHDIPLHTPSSIYEQKYGDMSSCGVFLAPVNVGYGVACDHSGARIPLTAAELSELGFGLYEFLKTLPPVRLADVGWDPDSRLSVAELLAEWSEELQNGEMPGIVVHNDLADLLPGREHRERFNANHHWYPYRGEKSGTIH